MRKEPAEEHQRKVNEQHSRIRSLAYRGDPNQAIPPQQGEKNQTQDLNKELIDGLKDLLDTRLRELKEATEKNSPPQIDLSALQQLSTETLSTKIEELKQLSETHNKSQLEILQKQLEVLEKQEGKIIIEQGSVGRVENSSSKIKEEDRYIPDLNPEDSGVKSHLKIDSTESKGDDLDAAASQLKKLKKQKKQPEKE